MIMQEERRSRAGDCDPQPEAHLGRNRLERARSLLRETECRLAAAADVHAVQPPPLRPYSWSEQAEHELAIRGSASCGSASCNSVCHGIRSDELALLRCFEQGGVHEIGTSVVKPVGADARPLCDVMPHACLIFLANWLLNADDHASGLQETEGPSGCVAWIGDRVHPVPQSLQMAVSLRGASLQRAGSQRNRDALLRHSIFIRDSELAFAPVRHGHLSRNACQRRSDVRARSGTVKRLQMDARACNRLWCAEQAVRIGAAQVVIVDGTGFSTLAWRRLQLAVDAAGAQGRVTGYTARPCVLVVTSSSNRQQSVGCAATARWIAGVAAPDIERGARDIECGARDIECGARDIECGARDIECGARDDVAFAWQLRLMSARQFGLQGMVTCEAACEVACENEGMQADAGAPSRRGHGSRSHSASDRGCIGIVMPRSVAGARADAAWELVRVRAHARRARRACHARVGQGLNDVEPARKLAAESAMRMACLDEGARSWRARSA